jgi:hypothetical protein
MPGMTGPRDPSPPQESDLDLSIVMPCLNEAETVARCVTEARAAIDRAGLRGEVVVGDNGSTDGSRELAAAAGARVVPVATRGYGAAILGGVEAARGRWVIIADSDGQHDFADVDLFVAKLREGYELVVGKRVSGEPGAVSRKSRYIGTPIISTIGRVLFGAPLSDFNCGFRGVDRDRMLSLGLRTTGMELASEHIIKSALARLRIAQVPVNVRAPGRSRPAHLRPFSDGWRHLRFMLLMSPRGTLIAPGLALMVLSLIAGVWLVIHPLLGVPSGGFSGPGLALSALGLLAGYQAATLGVAAHVYAVEQGLLQPTAFLKAGLKRFTMERGIVVGLVLGAGGLATLVMGLITALARPEQAAISSLQVACVGGVLLALGLQTVLMSFFYSMLGLPYRGRPAGMASAPMAPGSKP